MQVLSPDQNVANSGIESNQGSIELPVRIVIGCLGLGMLGLLVLARFLEPNPSGIGTHRQLGFPPCGFLLIFGVVCPSCGMTTAWALATRGNWITGFQSNAGGFLMALLALPAGIWLLASAIRGRWVWWRPDPLILGGLMAAVILTAMIQWALRVL